MRKARPRGPADTRPRLNRPGTHVVYGRSDRHAAGQTLWLVDIEGQRDEDHLAQAAWNLIGALHTEEAISRAILPPELDDRPDFTKARRG